MAGGGEKGRWLDKNEKRRKLQQKTTTRLLNNFVKTIEPLIPQTKAKMTSQPLYNSVWLPYHIKFW